MLTRKELLKVEFLSKKYDEANIPLYLSYPVSSWWKTNLNQEDYLHAYHKRNIPFLYFHFPYCARECYYCACYKVTAQNSDQNDTYIHYLTKEYDQKCSLLGVDRFDNVKHLHWGGGTPTLMSCQQIENIFNILADRIRFSKNDPTSISVEAYPSESELSIEKLSLLRELGFNEISFGVQDFNERIQKTIKRKTPKDVVRRIVEMSRGQGFRVHVDLCYGLPFQGINELEDTVQTIIDMAPDRVALFAYAHYPLAFPLQRQIPRSAIPNSFIRVLLNMKATEMFTASGYKKVGHDHFVKENNALYHASRHGKVVRDFMGYSVAERRQFIGFGNAAISFFGNCFFQNIISIEEYYKNINDKTIPLQTNSGHVLSADDQTRNELIQQHILGNFRVSKQEIACEHSIDFDSYFSSELGALKRLEEDGLIQNTDDGTILLTAMGHYFARHIAYVFDNYR